MACDQETCPMWDGDGCPCERFGLDKDDLPDNGVYHVVEFHPFEDTDELTW